MLLAFGDHVLDSERRELRRGGEPLALEPQVFDLLVSLVQNRDRVVSKDDLLHAVWGGRIVSDSALAARINAARRALDDNGAAQRWIRTLPRKGVRFIGIVREAQEPAPVSSPPPRLSIVVLPFLNLSSDPEQQYFADGMVEEITTAIDSRGGGDDAGAASASSRTAPMKRTPLRGRVRIHRCALPLSPSALRAALMRAASAASDTIRPPHTACSRSSLLTTRSWCCTK